MTRDALAPRRCVRRDADWLYRDGVVGNAHERRRGDRAWQRVHLPPAAAIGRPFDYASSSSANGWIPLGAGAYRRHFSLPAAARGQRLLLEFEGVYRDAQVWVNGRCILLVRARHDLGPLTVRAAAPDLAPGACRTTAVAPVG